MSKVNLNTQSLIILFCLAESFLQGDLGILHSLLFLLFYDEEVWFPNYIYLKLFPTVENAWPLNAFLKDISLIIFSQGSLTVRENIFFPYLWPQRNLDIALQPFLILWQKFLSTLLLAISFTMFLPTSNGLFAFYHSSYSSHHRKSLKSLKIETGADYTEWSKPERKTPITHIYGI